MKKVSFTEMKYGTKEDYLLLSELEKPYLTLTADRIISELQRQGEDTLSGYQITRLEHALQAGTRAYRDGADLDWIVSALLHDIGDGLAPQNHDRFSAEVIRPYVREEVTWVIEHHGIFQMIYYAHHYGWEPDAREKFRDNIYFKSCEDFCERWDQASFDPDYPSESIEFFEPMIREVFNRKAYDPQYIQSGVVKGLPKVTE
ncbi:MAG: HD domain-containing protein [Paracoccaceae bacterium]|nr:HD domain-containing protein [Paracoccaceae bacterium]MDE2759118.1 HD domain-containing protein [Paracoccaceae bacterium]MDE2916194.1 HD domain-containing protein [Paracoccaceae bacterium]